MTSNLIGMTRPPVGYGPGSQPADAEDGEGLNYLPMPKDMQVYAPHVPEVADPGSVVAGLARLDALQGGLAGHAADMPFTVTLDDLSGADRKLIDEALGEGEVSALVIGPDERIEIQEATLAGVWRLRLHGRGGRLSERVEVGAFPRVAVERAFPPRRRDMAAHLAAPPPGVVNAPAILAELDHRSRIWVPGTPVHVINLSLLPHSPEDTAFLEQALGQGATTVLSRGYGNCRLTSTGLQHVWCVRYYNSVDTLILDTLEVTDLPEVACAAIEDIADSAERLGDIIAAIR
ncbi:hydrogenase expression/formation protein [Zavarzinia compransoris]|uniref:Hydrogenase expression/formation protein n=1 Tax=Zavarzinia compransoris TaxID=1264899 RepID=A0A317EAH6_9PROT|nr:hydrogenase expression/formation protein [Zavarzinia compransoris]PWR23150.1 hydrogenase expression/formation protein [Zavarzinia compransoris]TDP46293.1 hydrogenase-1 operon protein HyaF [Zavarzinia compransoris]